MASSCFSSQQPVKAGEDETDETADDNGSMDVSAGASADEGIGSSSRRSTLVETISTTTTSSSNAGSERDATDADSLDIGDVNGNSTKGVSTRPLSEALTDAGRFAYCGLVTSALCHLFTDDTPADTDFALTTLNRLARHLDLPAQVCQVMEMNLKGEIEPSPTSNYISILKEEPPLARSRVAIVQDLVTFAVQGGCYDARIRVLITHVTCLLQVSVDLLEMYEESVLEYLTMEHVPPSEEEELEKSKRNRYKKIRRYTAIGLATLGGGAVLGLTGGLAAPFIGAGIGTIIGAGGAAAISSTAGIAVVGSMFGVAGAGLTGFKMQKRIGDIEEFAFESLSEGSHLHITIAISGWLTKEDPAEFMEPWRTLYHSREQYVLRYESTYLLELGQAMDYLLQFALSMAVQETLKYTILAGIISAITWPTSLLTLASIIDNPWGVCCRRSAEVGRQLAEVLVQRQHGKRPVTLIGFSLGARVIYYCLEELVKRKGSAGVVQDAIFLGAPVPGHGKEWKEFRHVVSGRIINGYCSGDWLLRFLYRSSTGTMRIAGLSPVDWQDRRMFNFDLSDIVAGHMDYAKKMDVILRLLGIRTRDPVKDLDPRVKKSASDYPGFMSMHGKMEKPGIRTSTSDSFLLCGRDAPLTRSYSTDDILMAACDDELSKMVSEETKSRARSSSDIMQKSMADVGRQGSVLQHTMKTRESLEALNCCAHLSEREQESRDTVRSKPFFGDLFSKKPAAPAISKEQPKTQQVFAQERFKRRTVSSSNLFLPRTSSVGKREFLRSSSQDQSKGSFFQFFTRKQEPIDEDP